MTFFRWVYHKVTKKKLIEYRCNDQKPEFRWLNEFVDAYYPMEAHQAYRRIGLDSYLIIQHYPERKILKDRFGTHD